MTRKQAINRAKQITVMLEKLQEKAEQLSDEIANIEDNQDYDDPSLRDLRYTLDDLVNFDLEDSVISAEE